LAKRWAEAVVLNDLVPSYPLGLCVKALELNGDVLDASVNWLIEKGEAYSYDHPEVMSSKNPLEEVEESTK